MDAMSEGRPARQRGPDAAAATSLPGAGAVNGAPGAPETLGDRLEHAIERRTDVAAEVERESPPSSHRLRRTIFWLAVTGVSLYLVFPSVVDVLGSWRDVNRFSVAALAGMFGLQAASLACLWALQAVALHTRRWRAVIASQLAGNALAKIAPGGGAIGAGLQYRILVRAGLPGPATATGLTAVNVIVFAIVLAMPVLAIPALLRGGVDKGLLHIAAVGLVVFVVAAALGAVLLVTDGPLRWVGRLVQRIRNRL